MLIASGAPIGKVGQLRTFGKQRRRITRVASGLIVSSALVLAALLLGGCAAAGATFGASAGSTAALGRALEATVRLVPADESGMGSGVALTAESVLTAEHVVASSPKGVAYTTEGLEYPYEVVWSDRRVDVAIVKSAGARFKSIRIGDSTELVAGQPVWAIGYPLDLSRVVVTKGVVGSPAQRVDGNTYIQTDAAVNPGNSGGPLVDEDGKLIGINVAKAAGLSGEAAAEGLGFAVPLAVVASVYGQELPGAGASGSLGSLTVVIAVVVLVLTLLVGALARGLEIRRRQTIPTGDPGVVSARRAERGRTLSYAALAVCGLVFIAISVAVVAGAQANSAAAGHLRESAEALESAHAVLALGVADPETTLKASSALKGVLRSQRELDSARTSLSRWMWASLPDTRASREQRLSEVLRTGQSLARAETLLENKAKASEAVSLAVAADQLVEDRHARRLETGVLMETFRVSTGAYGEAVAEPLGLRLTSSRSIAQTAIKEEASYVAALNEAESLLSNAEAVYPGLDLSHDVAWIKSETRHSLRLRDALQATIDRDPAERVRSFRAFRAWASSVAYRSFDPVGAVINRFERVTKDHAVSPE